MSGEMSGRGRPACLFHSLICTSLGSRGWTRATRCITHIVLYTNVDVTRSCLQRSTDDVALSTDLDVYSTTYVMQRVARVHPRQMLLVFIVQVAPRFTRRSVDNAAFSTHRVCNVAATHLNIRTTCVHLITSRLFSVSQEVDSVPGLIARRRRLFINSLCVSNPRQSACSVCYANFLSAITPCYVSMHKNEHTEHNRKCADPHLKALILYLCYRF